MKHPNTVEFLVYGPYGLFSDPITKLGGEKCSYQVPTYEALKGIAASIYWKPTFLWYIDKVRVLNQIQTEVKGIRTIKYTSNKTDLSYYTYLKDCAYQVKALHMPGILLYQERYLFFRLFLSFALKCHNAYFHFCHELIQDG